MSFANLQMFKFGQTVNAMLFGAREVDPKGFALGRIPLADRMWMDGPNWRAECLRCKGTGTYTGRHPKKDLAGRGYICFACQGKGEFKLPDPETYTNVCRLYAAVMELRASANPDVMKEYLTFAVKQTAWMLYVPNPWYEQPYQFYRDVIDGKQYWIPERICKTLDYKYSEEGHYVSVDDSTDFSEEEAG